jgi:DNA repair protein RadD
MSYILRDYQQQASDSAVTFFNNKTKKTNAIMVLPTGSGKSLIIADIASRLDGHTLVFQPSKEKKKKQT